MLFWLLNSAYNILYFEHQYTLVFALKFSKWVLSRHT